MTPQIQKLLDAICEIVEEQVTSDTPLERLKLWDSMAVVMTVAAVENECDGKRVAGPAVWACKTVQDIIELPDIRSA
jgi:acyl carrier protein